MDDGFPIVVVLGLAIFGMIWIGSQTGDGFGINGEQAEEMTLYSSSPGTIGESNEDFRTISFKDFTVGETRGDIQAYTSERERLANGILSGQKVVINYNATQPGQGQVNFEVLGRQAKGKIYVKVNGNQVYKAATISGATPEINISRDNFNAGRNKIVIGTTQPNPLKKAVYSIEDVEATVNDRKFHDFTGYFQMYQHELDSFRPSNLTFQVPVDQSIPQEPLGVEVNEQEVFNQRIGRSTQEITLTPGNADLSTGYNTIKFGTDGESKYTVQNPEIQVRYAVNVQPATDTINFELDQGELDYAQRDNTEETLRFNYQRTNSAAPLTIQLNNFNETITPQNGINTVDIEEDTVEEENTLDISSSTTFNIEKLNLESKKSE